MANQSIDKKIRKSKMAIVFLIMILISVISFIIIFKTDLLTVKKVEVDGNHAVTKEEIVNKCGIIFGNNIFKENIGDIQSNLYTNPYIKEVKIERKLPNTMLIHVIERESVAAIPFMNDFLIIDQEGMVLKSSSNNENLRIIRGLKFSDFMEGSILNVKNKKQFDQSLKIVNGIDLNNISIKELDVANEDKIFIYITTDLICKIGEGDDLNYRLKMLGEILEDLKQKNKTKGIIDMSHSGYPNYRATE